MKKVAKELLSRLNTLPAAYRLSVLSDIQGRIKILRLPSAGTPVLRRNVVGSKQTMFTGPREPLLLVSGAVLLLAGVAVLYSLSTLFGAPLPVVSIAWKDPSAERRVRAEANLRLPPGVPLVRSAFKYTLPDRDPVRLKAIASHQDVLAVDGLDRRTGQLSSHVALSARTGGMFLVAPLVSKGTKAMGIGLLALGLALISIGLLGPVLRVRLRTLTLRDALQATGAFLERGVPSATPDAAGAFRIVFGAFVLWFLHANQAQHFVVTGAEASSATGPYGLVVRWLAGHPGSLTVVDVVLWTCGALFLVGFATRLTYALLVAAFLTWVSAFTLRNSIHPISALSVTLVCLLPASWGDGLSVDAWLRRRQGAPAPVSGKRYGFAIWVPGFVFGLAFLAAAWAKAGVNGEWVFNGTVKYHFLSDLDSAAVPWGMQLTRSHVVAVLMSAVAVVVETLVIAAAFSKPWAYRLAAGAGVLSLLIGFFLFQGVFWPAWWALLMGFLPWQLLFPSASPLARPPSQLTPAQLAMVVLALGQQLLMSTLATDARPFFSMYDMYSATHRSEENDAVHGSTVYRVVAALNDGWVPLDGCVIAESEVAGLQRVIGDVHVSRSVLNPAIVSCLRQQPTVTRFRLDGDRQQFDWSTGTLVWKRRVDVVGPVRID